MISYFASRWDHGLHHGYGFTSEQSWLLIAREAFKSSSYSRRRNTCRWFFLDKLIIFASSVSRHLDDLWSYTSLHPVGGSGSGLERRRNTSPNDIYSLLNLQHIRASLNCTWDAHIVEHRCTSQSFRQSNSTIALPDRLLLRPWYLFSPLRSRRHMFVHCQVLQLSWSVTLACCATSSNHECICLRDLNS